ncbi:response regulator [Alteromonas halophila]|uniref:response regulator n=1 Tax=Alteromonas halophila TaxID=516698 RepID=UPI00167AB9DA|nr:response regulator [Alteromonas halophila]
MSFNVLICDDSAMARKMAKRALPSGFSASMTEAANGLDALDVISSQPIDLLLLDLTMPVLDGIGVLEELRRRQQKVFVIVVSGDVQPVMRQRVVELGALAFLPKPVSASTLCDVLEQYGFSRYSAVVN